MITLLERFSSLTLEERIYLFLIIAIAFLVLVTLFFALTALLFRFRNLRKAKRWQRLEDRWKPLILEIMVGEIRPEKLQDSVNENERLFFMGFLVRYARRLTGEEEVIIRGLAAPHLPTMERLSSRGKPEARAQAIQTLGTLGLPEYGPAVVAALDDESPFVAMVAARVIAQREYLSYAREVIPRLHRFLGWSREYLASLLENIGYEIAPDLRALILDRSQPVLVRAVAIDALRTMNDLEAADPVINVITGESDRDLVAAGLRLLTVLGRPEHCPVIRLMMMSEDYIVRALASQALGLIGSESDWDYLEERLDDSSPWVAYHAARALRDSGATERLRLLGGSSHWRSDLARQILVEGT